MYGKDAEPSFITSFADREQTIDIGVFLRPYLFDLLSKAGPHFDICVFTASEKVYADAILNQVDPLRKLFTERIYRQHCLKATLPNTGSKESRGTVNTDSTESVNDAHERTIFVKDLRIFAQESVCKPGTLEQYPLSDIIIVDNSLLSFALQPDNGIPISAYFWDNSDQELRCLANYLVEKLAPAKDIRVVNKAEFKLQNIIDLSIQSQLITEERDRYQSV